MQTRITTEDRLVLAGMSFYGDPFSTHGAWSGENEIGRVWTRFMTYLEGHHEQLEDILQPGVFYEVHTYSDETVSRGLFEVFVGARLTSLEGAPPALLIKTLPASEYAVFTVQGEEIATDWYSQAETWIADSGYQRAHDFTFQYYDERFKGVEQMEESVLDVYIPIKPAA